MADLQSDIIKLSKDLEQKVFSTEEIYAKLLDTTFILGNNLFLDLVQKQKN